MAPVGVLIVAAVLAGPERTAHNSVSVELLGSAAAYALSYERIVGDRLSLRLGIGRSTFTFGDTATAVPASVSYLVGAGDSFLEVGAGATYFHGDGIFQNDTAPGDEVVASAIFGYRYAPRDGGGTIRLAVMPMVNLRTFDVFPWIGLLLGRMF